jgi:CBS domain-containing protein
MSEKSVGSLLVMSDGQLAGIISERDYARKVILKDRSSKQTQVREIMTTPVITVTPRDTVEDCMRTMTENRIRHLPVVDRDRVVGVISIGDMVNWIITAHEETIGHLQSYIAGQYPG